MPEEILGDRPAGERNEDEQEDRDPAADGDLVALEHAPDGLPISERVDLVLLLLDDRRLCGHVGNRVGVQDAHEFTTSTSSRARGPRTLLKDVPVMQYTDADCKDAS